MSSAPELAGEALRAYQAEAGLVVDGKLGPMTRAALLADSLIAHMSDLIGYRGSLGLLIRCEGFRGRPYWPGGQSGVTLDYGFDLAHHTEAELCELYGHLWPGTDVDLLCACVGVRGKDARQWLAWMGTERELAKRWPITREQAAQVLPRAAGPYWHAAVKACPALRDAPPRVQSALLSVTYSAWVECVRQADAAIGGSCWNLVAGYVRASKGDPKRREIEAQLIESAMGGSADS